MTIEYTPSLLLDCMQVDICIFFISSVLCTSININDKIKKKYWWMQHGNKSFNRSILNSMKSLSCSRTTRHSIEDGKKNEEKNRNNKINGSIACNTSATMLISRKLCIWNIQVEWHLTSMDLFGDQVKW